MQSYMFDVEYGLFEKLCI